MRTWDCMTPDEYAFWVEAAARVGRGRLPCADCPLSYADEMRAAGRCKGEPKMVGGRPRAPFESEREMQRRRQREYRARLKERKAYAA